MAMRGGFDVMSVQAWPESSTLLTPWTGHAALWTGVILSALIAIKLTMRMHTVPSRETTVDLL
jgi:hypothetical protein